MENITPQQKRKLEKILRLGENGLPALLEYIFELEEMIQERNDVDMKIIKASVTNILKDMKGDKGDSYVLTDKDKEDISYAIRELFDDSEIAKRAMSLIDQKSIVKQVVSEIVIPKPKDGNTPDNNHLTNLIKPLIPKINTQAIEDNAVQKAIAELKPLIPSVPTFIDVRNAFEVFSDEEKLKMSAIYKLEETIDEIKKNVENSYTRVISNNRNLSNLLDVNLSGLAVNQSIKWDGVQWIPYTPGSGGGAVDSVNGLTGVVSIGLQSVTGVGATTTIQSTFSSGIVTNLIKATTSAGLLLEDSTGTDIGLLGAGNTANVAWYGSHTFAGNVIIDTNTLYVDATTHNVGLGLTGATHQLHVRGAGQATANLTDAGATGATIFLQDTGASNSNGGAVIFGANNQSWAAIKGIYTSGANNGLGDLVISTRRLSTNTALTEAVRITSGGNLTILSPVAVSANSQFSIRTNSDRNFAWTGFNGAPEMFSINDAFNAYTELRINGSPLLLNNASTGNIQMVVGGGRVTIGGTSALAKFSVAANNASFTPLTIGTNNVFVANFADNLNDVTGVQMGNTSTGTSADFRFLIADTTGHYFAFMQPGVNNTASTIMGQARATNNFIISSAGTGRGIVIGTTTGHSLILGTNNTTRLTINNAGALTYVGSISQTGGGITSSGSFTGGVGGTATATIISGQRWQLASSGTSGDFLIRNESALGPVKIQFGGISASFPSIENIGANLIIRSANATNATRVAIGAVSPGAMLHVTSLDDATIAGIFQAASLSAVNTVEFRNSAGSTMSNIDKDGKYIFGSPSAILTSTFGATTSIVSSSPASWATNQVSIESKGASGASAGAFLGLYSNDGAAMASGDRLGGFFVGGFDGTNIRNATMIHGFATEAWSSTVSGADLVFATTTNGTTTRTDKFWMKHNGNFGFRTSTEFGSGVGVIGMANATTVPTTNPTGGGVWWIEAGALKYRGSAGTVTTLAVA